MNIPANLTEAQTRLYLAIGENPGIEYKNAVAIFKGEKFTRQAVSWSIGQLIEKGLIYKVKECEGKPTRLYLVGDGEE